MTATNAPGEWSGHALREAAAILAESMPLNHVPSYDLIVRLVALGWMQGVDYGTHHTLSLLDVSLAQMQAEVAK